MQNIFILVHFCVVLTLPTYCKWDKFNFRNSVTWDLLKFLQ
jgi:hypothetical protein